MFVTVQHSQKQYYLILLHSHQDGIKYKLDTSIE